jgi:hypothetical protein
VPEFRVAYTVTTDKLDALYRRLKPKGVTMTGLLAKAAGVALAKHPLLFASASRACSVNPCVFPRGSMQHVSLCSNSKRYPAQMDEEAGVYCGWLMQHHHTSMRLTTPAANDGHVFCHHLSWLWMVQCARRTRAASRTTRA